MAPTPAKPPVPVGLDHHLVDRVISAYGMNVPRSHTGDHRAAELYHRVHAFVGEVEVKVMTGALRRVSTPAVDDKGRPLKDAPPSSAQRLPLVEEQQLLALWDELTKLNHRLSVPGSAYAIPEQTHLDAAFSELARAADSLRLGLGDDTYTALEGEHRAWLARYAAHLAAARAAKVAELMNGPQKMSQREAEAAVRGMDIRLSDEPLMRAPVAPALLPAANKVAPTLPKATAPAASVGLTPPTPPAEAVPAVPAEPASEPAATDLAPVEAPAVETPAEMPVSAPAEAEPAETAAPAADAAPAEVPAPEAEPAEVLTPEAEPAPAPAEAPAALPDL